MEYFEETSSFSVDNYLILLQVQLLYHLYPAIYLLTEMFELYNNLCVLNPFIN